VGRMQAFAFASLAAAALVLCLPGCASTSAESAPGWIDQPPLDDEYLYAIGAYHGALYPENNYVHAMTRAREEIAKNMQSRVQGSSVLKQSMTQTRWKSEVLVDADEVLEMAEVVDNWVDTRGAHSRRGTVWVLMRMPRRAPTGDG
jgi:hypothetical protein